MFDKKGQSALEYLMTYGWALVVIVIVIAALVIIIDPSAAAGNSCTSSGDISVKDHVIDGTGMQMVLTNKAGYAISDAVTSISGTVDGISVTDTNTLDLSVGDTKVTYAGIAGTGTYNLDLTIVYNTPDGLGKTASATCMGTG
jgi:hypothetical protein